MLFFTQPIYLVVEEISRNKLAVQTRITYFLNQKDKHVAIRYNSILTLIMDDLLLKKLKYFEVI